jgi:hypothetical protein
MSPLLSPRCGICDRPIERDGLKYIDEDGSPVHEPCYIEKVTKKKAASTSHSQSKVDSLA